MVTTKVNPICFVRLLNTCKVKDCYLSSMTSRVRDATTAHDQRSLALEILIIMVISCCDNGSADLVGIQSDTGCPQQIISARIKVVWCLLSRAMWPDAKLCLLLVLAPSGCSNNLHITRIAAGNVPMM